MKKMLCFLVLAPLVGLGQGVRFENGLDWSRILAKAKAENKYIFVYCKTSWSEPCKQMDKDIYSNDSVGAAMNDRFISISVQMDTTKKDNDTVKAWYGDAHMLMATYKVSVFPSFLFFTSDGKIVHREIGSRKPEAFIEMTKDAQNIEKQYYPLLARYRSGTKDISVMRYLATSAKTYNEPELASSIAADYLHDYLDKLSYPEICNKKDLDFIASFAKVVGSNDKVFKCLYEHGELADSVVHDKDFARRFVNFIITKEEITPMMLAAKTENKEPNWNKIKRSIRHKFGVAYVEANVVPARVRWYRSTQNWKAYAKYLVIQLDQQGIQNISNDIFGRTMLNNSAWDVFMYSDNKKELEKALTWSDKAIEMENHPSANHLDTKANLLYKLGRKNEAIDLEIKASKSNPNAKNITESLEKMKHDEPTWVSR